MYSFSALHLFVDSPRASLALVVEHLGSSRRLKSCILRLVSVLPSRLHLTGIRPKNSGYRAKDAKRIKGSFTPEEAKTRTSGYS